MTRFDKARTRGMLHRERDKNEACPADYKCGPGMDEETVCNKIWKNAMQLYGCRGISCHACWKQEYTE